MSRRVNHRHNRRPTTVASTHPWTQTQTPRQTLAQIGRRHATKTHTKDKFVDVGEFFARFGARPDFGELVVGEDEFGGEEVGRVGRHAHHVHGGDGRRTLVGRQRHPPQGNACLMVHEVLALRSSTAGPSKNADGPMARSFKNNTN